MLQLLLCTEVMAKKRQKLAVKVQLSIRSDINQHIQSSLAIIGAHRFE